MRRDILNRLKALEASRAGTGLSPAVSFMESLEDGTWRLSCGLWDGKKDSRTVQSRHQTESEAKSAYDAFLKQYPRCKQEPVLIIDDL